MGLGDLNLGPRACAANTTWHLASPSLLWLFMSSAESELLQGLQFASESELLYRNKVKPGLTLHATANDTIG